MSYPVTVIRSFIAIDVPEHVRTLLEAAQQQGQRARPGVKVSWLPIRNTHLTLQFLGDIREEQCPDISTALNHVVTGRPSFDIVVRGLGGFPNTRVPRVLWAGCDDADGQLAGLAVEIQRALIPLGFAPEERAFAGHLTLGRVKFPRPDGALTSWLDCFKDTAYGTMRVDQIHFYKSQLHPDGAIYTKISSHTLGSQAQSSTTILQ